MKNVIGLTQAQSQYAVNRRNQPEGIWQPAYDTLAYPAAGTPSLIFFQNPVGQGNPAKTYADTNMEAAGSFPAPKSMLVTGLSVAVYPGISPFNAENAPGDLESFWADMYELQRPGSVLRFFIGSKDYLIDGPISIFPPEFRLDGIAALSDTTTAADNRRTEVQYAQFAGKPYEITPVYIPSVQNFKVSLEFPTPRPLPSGEPAQIQVRLNGFQYRLSQ